MIARLLHVANSQPFMKSEFYELKKAILERRGKSDGYDIQHFGGKICFGCDGTGEWYHPSGDYGDICERCGGSGYWKRPCVVVLDRFKFGRYPFHSIQKVVYDSDEIDYLVELDDQYHKKINGFIRHKYYGGWKAENATLWLFLIHRRFRWFWQGVNEPKKRFRWWRHPFGWIQYAAFCRSRRRQKKRQRIIDRKRSERIRENIEVPF